MAEKHFFEKDRLKADQGLTLPSQIIERGTQDKGSRDNNSPTWITGYDPTNMFIEPLIGKNKDKENKGHIEVICGSMFSGKTEELIRRLNRALIAKQKVEIFKPAMDKRYHQQNVISHNENSIRSTPVQFAKDIILLSGNCDVVGIDEVQFFDHQIVQVANSLARSGKRVVLAGLDMDFEGKPFEPIPQLMAIAEYVTKVHAICMKCGELASYSFRLSDSKEKVMLGEKDSYEARCRKCFYEEKM